MKLPIASLFALALAGCPSTPAVTPPPDASDAVAPPPPAPAAGDCTAACSALTAAGCALGSGSICPGFLQTMSTAGKTPNPANGNRPLTCADITPATVKTKADAQKLGFACP